MCVCVCPHCALCLSPVRSVKLPGSHSVAFQSPAFAGVVSALLMLWPWDLKAFAVEAVHICGNPGVISLKPPFSRS